MQSTIPNGRAGLWLSIKSASFLAPPGWVSRPSTRSPKPCGAILNFFPYLDQNAPSATQSCVCDSANISPLRPHGHDPGQLSFLLPLLTAFQAITTPGKRQTPHSTPRTLPGSPPPLGLPEPGGSPPGWTPELPGELEKQYQGLGPSPHSMIDGIGNEVQVSAYF